MNAYISEQMNDNVEQNLIYYYYGVKLDTIINLTP